MGLLGNPPNGMGGSFFFAPGPEPAAEKGIMGFEGLALNVLRRLQFSYMMMKGFRSTTRALKDMDFSRDDGGMFGDGTAGGRCSNSSRWGPGSGGGKVGRIGTPTSSCRLSLGKSLGGRSGGGGVRNGRGIGAGRRARCTGDNVGNIRGGEGNLEGKGAWSGGTSGNSRECRGSKWSEGGNGALTGNAEGKGIKGPQARTGAATTGRVESNGIEGTPGGNGATAENAGANGTPRGSGDGTKFGDMNISGSPTTTGSLTPAEGVNGSFLREGSSAASGIAIGESRIPADGALSSKLSDGMTNRTLAGTGLGAVDSISNQLKPMKGFMKSVKMATGVVSGVKTATGVIQKFQAPAGGVLIGFGAANGVVLGFETARMIVKAGKISKDFASVWKSTRTHIGMFSKADINAAAGKARRETLLKGLKASDGALTLVRLTKEFGAGLGGNLQGGLTNWDLVSKSYDLTNGILKVFEAVLGLKGGGMIGLVGQGFAALKGAAGGLGLSVKLVKAVVVSKEISIFLLKGFGISKTAIEALKATQDGKMMVKWLIYKDGSKDPADKYLLTGASIASLKGRTGSHAFELLMTNAQQPAAGSEGNSPSLMHSLASLLFARFQASDTCDPDEDGSPSYIFFLSLPS